MRCAVRWRANAGRGVGIVNRVSSIERPAERVALIEHGDASRSAVFCGSQKGNGFGGPGKQVDAVQVEDDVAVIGGHIARLKVKGGGEPRDRSVATPRPPLPGFFCQLMTGGPGER